MTNKFVTGHLEPLLDRGPEWVPGGFMLVWLLWFVRVGRLSCFYFNILVVPSHVVVRYCLSEEMKRMLELRRPGVRLGVGG